MSAPAEGIPADAAPVEDGAASLEPALLAQLQALALAPAARGLVDDCAVLDWPLGLQLVATHDMLAEEVHFTSSCPAAGIGWKLVAVNLSDLAAEGARPVGVLLGVGLGAGRPLAFARDLVRGVGQALARYGVALLGGDTIRSSARTVLSLTALGSVPAGAAIGRDGARPGDDLWLSGTIGAAGLGLRVARGEHFGASDRALLGAYRRPRPRLQLGLGLRGIATAMLDVSDGLLLDASRLARASAVGIAIDSARIPLAPAVLATGTPVAELATLGDDYELLFAAPAGRRAAVLAAAGRAKTPVTRIGAVVAGAGLCWDGAPAGASSALGFVHG